MPYGYGYFGQHPLDQLLAPARRASVLMFIVAALLLACGLLAGAAGAVFASGDLSQLPPDAAAQFRQMEQQLANMGLTVKGVFTGLAVIVAVVGVAMLVIGIVVRRGGMGAAIAGIILTCILALLAGLSVLSGIVEVGRGHAGAAVGVCMWGVMLAVLIFLLVWLFGAARNAGQVNAVRAQYGDPSAYGATPQYPQGQPGYPQPPPPQQWPPPPQGPGHQGGWGQPPPPPPPPPSA
jgi:hypothetical protein